MSKLRGAMVTLLLVLLFALGLFLGTQIGPRGGTKPRIHDTPALLRQVQTLSQFVTVKYVLDKHVVWEDPPKTILAQFVAGDNRVLLLAHGIVKAGVDFSRLSPGDLQIAGDKIIIRLPPPQITDAYLDEEETKVVERTTGFLRAFDKDLEQNVRATALADIRRAARQGGILKDAEERARTQLAALFLQAGFKEVEFRSMKDPPPAVSVTNGGGAKADP